MGGEWVGGVWGSREGHNGGFAGFLWTGLVGAEWLLLFAVSWWDIIKTRARFGAWQVWVNECGILWVLLGLAVGAIIGVKYKGRVNSAGQICVQCFGDAMLDQSCCIMGGMV